MSISSSNDRLPQLPFRRIWFFIGVSLILFFVGWDILWVTKRVLPLPKDDAELWSYHRRRVSSEGNKAVVLVGSSRMQVGIDQDKFTELADKKPIQLAIVGESPLPILKNLAEDETFGGTVIFDFPENLLYQKETIPGSFSIADAWVKTYQESKTSDDFEFWLRGYARYLIIRPELGKNPADTLQNIVAGRAFEERSIEKIMTTAPHVYLDRSVTSDLKNKLFTEKEQLEIEKNNQKTVLTTLNWIIENNPPQSATFIKIVDKIETHVKKIHDRGGKVIIVNFPISGEAAELHEKAFPRKDFWDVLAQQTSAKTIHFADYLSLSKFYCSDGTHVNSEDVPEFTENLVKIIYENQQ